jgi:hypothetical protein
MVFRGERDGLFMTMSGRLVRVTKESQGGQRVRERIYRWFCACIPEVQGGARPRHRGFGRIRVAEFSESKKRIWIN